MALDLKPDNMKHLVVVLSLLSCFLVVNAQNVVTEAEAINASSKYMQRFFRDIFSRAMLCREEADKLDMIFTKVAGIKRKIDEDKWKC